MSEVKSKSEISNGYLQNCLDTYGDLQHRNTEDSNVVVLGASGVNIGAAVADKLRSEGYKNIVMWDRCNGDLIEEQPELCNLYTDTDILIMCQGTTHIDWIEHQDKYNIRRQLNDSLYSHVLQTQLYVNNSINKPYRKTIIYVGSMAYRNILNGSSVYCAAKAGLNMFARCMGWELAPKGYDVYVIHPGNVDNTPMALNTMHQLQRYRGMTPLESRLYWNTGNPRKTILSAGDIATLISEICDNKLTYVAGNPIDLTGGQR